MVGTRVRFALSLLLLLLPFGVWAQTTESPDNPPGKLLLYVDQPAQGALSDTQLVMVSRSLLLGLQAGISGLSVSEPPGPVGSAAGDALSGLAQKAGAGFWLWAQVSTDSDKTRLRVRGFDVIAGDMKFDTTLTREGGLSPLELPFEKWDDVVSLLASSFQQALDQGDAAVPQEVTLTIRALPGTILTGPGKNKATVGRNGFAVMKLPGPGQYSLRATLSGYYPETSSFFAAGSKEVTLSQTHASWWALDASLLEMGYPSLDVTRFFVPNSLYVKLGLTTYAVGLAFTDTHVVTNNPLTNLVLQTGIYLRPEDVLFRAYINIGTFIRIVHASDTPLEVDPLSWGGFLFSIGTEIGRSPRGRFFFEYQPMFYASSVPGLFQASFGTGDPPDGWSFSDRGAFNFLCFRVGYRWTL